MRKIKSTVTTGCPGGIALHDRRESTDPCFHQSGANGFTSCRSSAGWSRMVTMQLYVAFRRRGSLCHRKESFVQWAATFFPCAARRPEKTLGTRGTNRRPIHAPEDDRARLFSKKPDAGAFRRRFCRRVSGREMTVDCGCVDQACRSRFSNPTRRRPRRSRFRETPSHQR